MKFIVTNNLTGEKQHVTKECVYRVKGRILIDSVIKLVEENGEPFEMCFEKEYDLKIEKGDVC